MMANLIRDLDIRIPVRIISKDRYLVGTKVRLAVILNDTITFRVGGGFMSFKEYMAKYADAEIARIKLKIVQTDSNLESVVNQMIVRVLSQDNKFKS
jgi:hypothetical protein